MTSAISAMTWKTTGRRKEREIGAGKTPLEKGDIVKGHMRATTTKEPEPRAETDELLSKLDQTLSL